MATSLDQLLAGDWGNPPVAASSAQLKPQYQSAGSGILGSIGNWFGNVLGLSTSAPQAYDYSNAMSRNPAPQSTNPQPQPKPQAKPQGTAARGTNYQEGGWYNGQQYHEGQLGPKGVADWWKQQETGGGGGGGGYEDLSQLISEQYEPALGALGGIEQNLRAGQQEGLTGVEKTFGEGQQSITGEQGELTSGLEEQGRRLGETVRGAYADALRAYNNLIQQGMARFGAGSSAGPAVSELINQEYMRSRGNLGEQAVSGEQQLAQEWTKMNNYIGQKKNDLESWKRGAIQTINDNFRNAMNEVAMRRGDIEANKTRDKVAALQNAVNQARQVESEDRSARMNLAQFAVETMQNLAQRAFTPQEIANIVGQVMQAEIPGLQGRTAAGGASAGGAANPLTYYNPYGTRKTEEEAAAGV